MGTVTVLRFATEQGAEDSVANVRELQRQHALTLKDAALVTWWTGKKSPGTIQRLNLATTGGIGGMGWSLLFGLIFFTPLFGIAVGVAIGTLGGVFGEYGIDDTFIRHIRASVTEGTSALFLISDNAIADTVVAAMTATAVEVIATQLSKAQERSLREAILHH